MRVPLSRALGTLLLTRTAIRNSPAWSYARKRLGRILDRQGNHSQADRPGGSSSGYVPRIWPASARLRSKPGGRIIHVRNDLFMASLDVQVPERAPCYLHSRTGCRLSVDAGGYTICPSGGAYDGVLVTGLRTRQRARTSGRWRSTWRPLSRLRRWIERMCGVEPPRNSTRIASWTESSGHCREFERPVSPTQPRLRDLACSDTCLVVANHLSGLLPLSRRAVSWMI